MKLKNLFNGLAAIALLATAHRAQAQGDDKLASVDIHTNAVCGDCKERIESEMIYVKGVRSVKVDLTNENIHVEYKAQKTDPAKLREAVAKIGYLADGVQPDPTARAALPACCRMTKEEHDAPPALAPDPAGGEQTVPAPEH